MEPGEKTEDMEFRGLVFELDSDLKQYAWISFGFGAVSCLLPLAVILHMLLGVFGISYGLKGRHFSRKGFAMAGVILSVLEMVLVAADFTSKNF